MINENLNEKRNIPLPEQVTFVINRLACAGFEAYAVGGCVRDHIMGNIPGDYDVTTSATPDEMLAVFEGERIVETGLKHGTVTVVKNGMNIETTTYRIDGSYADGRHPDSVSFTKSLSNDLQRRDFTINAMAYSHKDGVIDLFGGNEDIAKRRIRCVGCARKRFSEDGLRILRALRFSAVLGFTPDAECADAIRDLTPLLESISRERVYAELTKLLCGKNAGAVLSGFAEVIAHVLPPLTAEGVREAAGRIGALDGSAGDCAAVRYALLTDSLCTKDVSAVISSLKPSSEEKRAVIALAASRGASFEKDYDILCMMRDYGDSFPVRRAALEYAAGRISAEEAKAAADFAALAVAEDRVRRISQLKLGGGDLVSLGFSGAAVGIALRRLLDEVMLGIVPNEKTALLESARKLL